VICRKLPGFVRDVQQLTFELAELPVGLTIPLKVAQDYMEVFAGRLNASSQVAVALVLFQCFEVTQGLTVTPYRTLYLRVYYVLK